MRDGGAKPAGTSCVQHDVCAMQGGGENGHGTGKWELRIGNCDPELLRYELHFNMLQRVHHLLNRPGRQRHSQLANAGLRNANCGVEDP